MTNPDFIEAQKLLYKSLRPCHCPAIQETVHFNADGLKHLLYDKHRPRNIHEKYYRMGLVKHIADVISKATKAKTTEFAEPKCTLWILEWVEVKENNGKRMKVKVILRKDGNGGIFFWSVMARRNGIKN